MSDKIWVIKEGLEIFGPFNQAEIIAQINNKEILETDQIASPFSRFEFLKNCEEFNLLFKIIDHTEISKTEHTAATEKISQVDPSITGFFEIAVQPTKGTSRDPYKKLPASTIIDKKTTDQKETIDSSKKVIDKKSKPVDLLEPPIPIEKSRPLQRGLFLLLGVALVGFGLFYYQQQFVTRQQIRTQETNKTLLNLSIINKQIGNYERSAVSLKNILKLRPDHPEAFPNLIEVLILQGNYGEAQKRLSQKLKTSAPKKDIYNYLALIDLQKGELPKAEDNLNNALKQDPSFIPAMINLGTLYFRNEEYKKAAEQYDSDIITSSKSYPEFEGILILHRTANAVQYLRSKKDRENPEENTKDLEENTEDFGEEDTEGLKENPENKNLEDLIVSLEEYRERTYDFKLEASMMLAVSELVLGNIEKSREVLRDILELDLDLTNQHFHDVRYYYLDRLLWSNIIKPIFEDFEDKGFKWDNDPSLLAVYGFLIFKTGNKEEGTEHIDTALLLDQNNYKIKNLLAYIENESNRKENACETLNSIRELLDVTETFNSTRKNEHLYLLLRERLCIDKNDIETRKKLLTDLLSNQFRLQALTGLADISEREQDRLTAKKHYEEALRLSTNYIPLLELKANWDEE